MASADTIITLLGLGLIKINTLLANFNNPRPSSILNNKRKLNLDISLFILQGLSWEFETMGANH